MANAKKQKAAPLYQIHNVVREVTTRLTRAKQARRTRMTMLLGGGLLRVPRGRYVTVAEAMVRRLLAELTKKEEEGAVKVTTPDGRRIDLKTLKPLSPVATPAPLPQPPPDSAANDKTFEHGVGEGKPQMPGGRALSEDVKVPEVLNTALPEGVEEGPNEDLEAIAQDIYDGGWSHRELKEVVAPDYGVDDLSGNKMALAKRLAAAGMRMENYED